MEKHIEELKLLSVLQCVSAPVRQYIDRPSHALVFRRTGSIEYDFGGLRIPLEEGQIMFLPKGANFTVRQRTEGISRYTVVNFLGDFPLKEPQKCAAADLPELYRRLDLCSTLDPQRDRYALLAHFYEILSRLFEKGETAYHNTATLQLLDPAVDYLQQHLYDPGLSVGTLHSLCRVSDTYFRQLFIARFGVSPKKYVLQRRLSHAKSLLDSGECAGVSQAARLSGFEDALYFSKVFKARYGHPPSYR